MVEIDSSFWPWDKARRRLVSIRAVDLFMQLSSYVACLATVRNSLGKRSLVDAAELPLADQVASTAGEGSGRDDKTSPRLQVVAHHCSHC